MKAVFAGGYGIWSVGDDAMLVALVDGIRARDPSFEGTVLVRHRDRVASFYEQYGLKPLRNLDHESSAEARGRRFLGLNEGDDNAHLVAIYQALREADILILGGGEVLLDIVIGQYRGWMAYYGLLITLARFLDKPVMIAGAAIVPLASEEGKEAARHIVENASKVIVRDSGSAGFAADQGISFPEGKLSTLPDPAMGLVEAEDPAEVLRKTVERMPTRPRIGVSVRSLYWRWSEDRWEPFIDMFVDALDRLVDELDASLLFVPHNYYDIDGPTKDDKYLNKVIVERMKRSDRTVVIDEYFDVRSVLCMYGELDLVVGMRHHAAVLATRAGVPVLALSYSPKTDAIMADAGLGKNVMSIDTATADSILAGALELHARGDEVRKHLAAEVPRQRKVWQGYVDTALSLVGL